MSKRKKKKVSGSRSTLKENNKKLKPSGRAVYFIFGFILLLGAGQFFIMYKNSRNPSHGGIIKELNGKYYELLYFPNDGHLGLFLLDDETGGTAPIKRQQLTANIKFQDSEEFEKFTLEPHKQSSDPKGKVSFFMACAKGLKGKENFDVDFNIEVESKKQVIGFHVNGKAHSPDFRFKDGH